MISAQQLLSSGPSAFRVSGFTLLWCSKEPLSFPLPPTGKTGVSLVSTAREPLEKVQCIWQQVKGPGTGSAGRLWNGSSQSYILERPLKVTLGQITLNIVLANYQPTN